MDRTVLQRCARVKIVVMDVDGVLTDAGMYYTESGDEFKKFNTRDGLGIRRLQEAGISTAIVTGEETKIVERRAKKLRIREVHQGIDEKLPVVEGILRRNGLEALEACYIGDDLGDVEVLRFVGLAVAVADAVPEAIESAHYVTRHRGGDGAVRELSDLILRNRSA